MSKNIVVMDEEVKPLSVAERKKLEQLEGVIVANFQAFVTVGLALFEINDRKLYRESHKTFDRYCKEIFDLGSRRAYQLIDAAEVMQNVNNCSQKEELVIDLLPMNEAQVRPLVKFKDSPEQLAVVWRAVVENSGPERKVTASLVNKVVKGYLGEKVTTTIRNTQAKIRQEHVGADFKEAFDAFLEQLQKEKDANYKLTPREVIIKHLDQLRAEIAEDGELISDPVFTGASDDANKLERAGFRLFRMDRTSMTIKERAGGGWAKHSGPFETVKAMEAEFTELMKDEQALRG